MIGQNLDATATITLPSGGVDADETNNFRNLVTPVVAPEADLILAPVQESADPIDEAGTVVYSVQAGNSAGSNSPDAAPEGSVIQLRLTGGNGSLVSASPACEDLSSGGPEPIILNCSFGPMGPGATTSVFDVEVAPVGAPQTLEMTVEVRMPADAVEVDPSDNVRIETTTVNPVTPATYAYVVNQNGDNVSVVDADTDAVIQTITVGDNPYAAAITPDGSEVWVTHASGSVDIISTVTNTATLGAVTLRSGLFDVAFSPDGSTAYFARNTSAGSVVAVDVATRNVGFTISGLSFPRGLAILPNGSKGYVGGNGAVYVLDLVNGSLSKTIPVDGQTYFAAAAPDNSEVYVTQKPSSGAGLVRTIDTSTDALVGSGIPVGFNPYAIELNPAGTEAYVVDSSNSLYFVDLLGGSVITTAGLTTDASSRVGRTADGASLFVTSYSDPGSLFEVDAISRSVSATTPVGPYPIGLAVRQ
jgi:YVTN family beta-propeller protein